MSRSGTPGSASAVTVTSLISPLADPVTSQWLWLSITWSTPTPSVIPLFVVRYPSRIRRSANSLVCALSTRPGSTVASLGSRAPDSGNSASRWASWRLTTKEAILIGAGWSRTVTLKVIATRWRCSRDTSLCERTRTCFPAGVDHTSPRASVPARMSRIREYSRMRAVGRNSGSSSTYSLSIVASGTLMIVWPVWASAAAPSGCAIGQVSWNPLMKAPGPAPGAPLPGCPAEREDLRAAASPTRFSAAPNRQLVPGTARGNGSRGPSQAGCLTFGPSPGSMADDDEPVRTRAQLGVRRPPHG